MGVPSYFHWLVSKFEEDILKGVGNSQSKSSDQNHSKHDKPNKHTSKDKNQPEFHSVEEPQEPIIIDNLYLDLNCAIHPAVKQPGLFRKDMCSAVGEYLDKILETANPQKLLYIAIDGVAPRAKMAQQRKRRYKNIQDKESTNEIKHKFGVPIEKTEDFNMISPGTKFMEELSISLNLKIKRWKNKSAKWKDLKIIFSDATVPGEGEHKIMDHIRDDTTENDGIAVYGLDSDLIFLCLCNYRPNMYLLREKVHFGPKLKCSKSEVEYIYLSIDNLRESIIKILNPYVSLKELENYKIFGSSEYDTYTKTKEIEDSFTQHCEEMIRLKFFTRKEEEHNLIMDYIFICFMLGNDFLPSIPSLKIKEGGLDQILRVYKIVQMHQKDYLISNKTHNNKTSTMLKKPGYFCVNIKFFQDLLYQLTLLEDVMLQKQTQKRHFRAGNFYKSRDYSAAKNEFEKALLEFEYVENKQKDLILLGHPNWKDRYYKHHFNIENRNFHEFNKNIRDICHNFMEGMMWTLAYYQNTCMNWNWCYDHLNAPAVSDLYQHLKKINPNYINFQESTPATPLEQLMTILPPGSSHLLPPILADLMKNPESPIIYFYPINFELDTLNHRFRWECHPLLPKINPEKLKEAIEANRKFLQPKELQRNKLGSPFIYY